MSRLVGSVLSSNTAPKCDRLRTRREHRQARDELTSYVLQNQDLLNLIISKAVTNSKAKLLAALRLVNKQWNALVNTHIKQLTSPPSSYPHTFLSFTSVTSLDLSNYDHATDEDLQESLALLPSLHFLNLTDNKLLTDACLLSVVRSLTSLKALAITGCEKLSGDGLALLTALTSLAYLDLAECTQISSRAVESLAPLHCLTSLDLSCDAGGGGGLEPSLESGGGLAGLAPLQHLQSLTLSHCQEFNDNHLSCLAPLTALTHLDLSKCMELSGEGLTALAPLTALTSLSIFNCENLEDSGCRALAALTSLRTLIWGWSDFVSDAGLACLAPLKELRALHIPCLRLTDASLALLAPLTALTDLNVCHSLESFTGAGLRALGALRGLRALDLSGSNDLKGPDLQALRALPALADLKLEECSQLTDADIAGLAALTGLTALDLSGCNQVTLGGLAARLPFLKDPERCLSPRSPDPDPQATAAAAPPSLDPLYRWIADERSPSDRHRGPRGGVGF